MQEKSLTTTLNNEEHILSLLLKVIRDREFAGLLELQEILDVEEKYNGKIEISIYYAYYIMLDKAERNIFKGIKSYITKRNASLIEFYTNSAIDEIESFELQDDTLEQKLLFDLAMGCLNYYDSSAGRPFNTEVDYRKQISTLIKLIYKTEYSQFSDAWLKSYLMWMGTVDMDKYLTHFEKDILEDYFYQVIVTMLEIGFNEGGEEKTFEDMANSLNWR